jgi:glycine dehydrogenase
MAFDNFEKRHIGINEDDLKIMLAKIGVETLDELIDKTIPETIRLKKTLNIPEGISETEYLAHIWEIAQKNKVFKTYIGQGYYNTITPTVILRNIFENPSWYTSYTPYQAEISQGRLEALINFQTLVKELTGMQIANASLLDEATAAAEAMIMLFNTRSSEAVNQGRNIFFVDQNTFPQTIEVLRTRSQALGIILEVGDYSKFEFGDKIYGVLVQYPASDGTIEDYKEFISRVHEKNIQVAVSADLMSLVLLIPPGEWGADVVIGSAQRFGVPMGYGGPHAAYFATKEYYKRAIPGRIIGVTRDASGKPALRMALQTREQHIKRERATSNICTAQALLAIMASMYAVYHGKEGLNRIALHIHHSTGILSENLVQLGYTIINKNFFDTLRVKLPDDLMISELKDLAEEKQINLFYFNKNTIGISIDETTTIDDLNKLQELFAISVFKKYSKIEELKSGLWFDKKFMRESSFLQQDIFKIYRSETDMMRYIKKLENRDISLTHSMISLGSCTMKLNAASEMVPLSWPEFCNIHPFAPLDQVEGYHQILHDLGKWLCEITGFSEISFQPNSGAAGEYAGLMVIKKYHHYNGEDSRNVVLVPASAHGTNPASAVMAGYKVVVVECDVAGNISLDDLKTKAEQFRKELACLMLTYPSTHGVFEDEVKTMVNIVHSFGGQVYLDGANMNAQVGLTNPHIIGADVCHLNLHKTFAIPHGGGGPGMGPICVDEHLVEFLPTHPLAQVGGSKGVSAISASPWGSALIAIISYGYIKMLGYNGLLNATKYAILNANYLSACLSERFKIVYTGKNNTVAHEMIADCRQFKQLADITEIDIAKRLMDYGYHAPTVSFPVHGTLMIEPTESESFQELNMFVSALNNIYDEIVEIAESKYDKLDNVLKNSPHTVNEIASDKWNHCYSREKAAFPLTWIHENKFWPAVARVDDAYGDRNLVCSCEPIDMYRKSIKA